MTVKFYDPSKRGVGKFMRFDAGGNLLVSRTLWEALFGASTRFVRLGWDQAHRLLVIQPFEAEAPKCLRVTTNKGGHKISARGFVREFDLDGRLMGGPRIGAERIKKQDGFVIADCRGLWDEEGKS